MIHDEINADATSVNEDNSGIADIHDQVYLYTPPTAFYLAAFSAHYGICDYCEPRDPGAYSIWVGGPAVLGGFQIAGGTTAWSAGWMTTTYTYPVFLDPLQKYYLVSRDNHNTALPWTDDPGSETLPFSGGPVPWDIQDPQIAESTYGPDAFTRNVSPIFRFEGPVAPPQAKRRGPKKKRGRP